MKTLFLKLGALLFIFSLTISCDSDDADVNTEVNTEEAVAESDIELVDEVDFVIEEINTSVEQAFIEEENGLAQSRGGGSTSFFPECLTKTVVRTNTTKTITLDFGEGCMIRHRFMAGVLIMSYEKDRDLKTRTITVTYSNFRVDHKLVEGTHSVVRVRSNEDENPQSTATFDVEVTWDNGDIASRVGERTREWVEGVGTGFWGDNVYLITGSWTTTKRNGKTISTTITTPLRRELACKFIVSGVKEFEKEDRTASLDFGDGTCDNKAILTLDNGEEKEINLK